ncbi:MAG: type IX secretion system protein PorQ [Flavobacteriales bacterium]
MRYGILFIILIIFANPLFAQFGSDAFQALNLPLSSRLAVLNEPIALMDDDVEVGIVNPSMLNDQMNNQLSLNFVDYFSDINFISASYAFPFKDFGTMGVSIKSIGYGEFVETDIAAQNLGTFGANEQIIAVGLSKKLTDRWMVGASVKSLFSNFESYSSTAVATDMSIAYYNIEKKFYMTMLAKHIGRQLTSFTSTTENLPLQLEFGMSKRLEHLPFRFMLGYKNIQQWDLTYTTENTTIDTNTTFLMDFSSNLFRHIDFGGELSLGKHLQLRMGYSPKRRQELKVNSFFGMVGFSWGIGVKFSHFKIDYGRSTYHLHGSPNYFSFSTDISKFYRKK